MHNFDPVEIQKFSALSEEWWDPKGKCRPLHVLNPIRLQFICDRVIVEKKNIVDVGSGAGILTESLSKRGAFATGIDASAELIQVAKAHASLNQLDTIHYHESTAEMFVKTHREKFDLLTCMELLEHVPDPLSLIQACADLVKPGGDLFFSTLNRNLKSYLFAIIGAEYVFNLLPKNTHHYQKFIQPSELIKGLKAANLELLDISGMQYNPLTHRATLSPDVSVNYLIHAQKSKY